jgi:ABC-type Fe3+ transport system permease subunit
VLCVYCVYVVCVVCVWVALIVDVRLYESKCSCMTVRGQGQKKSARRLSALLSCVLCVLWCVVWCLMSCCVCCTDMEDKSYKKLMGWDGMGWDGMDEKG